MLNPTIYQFLEGVSSYLIFWIVLFLGLTLYRSCLLLIFAKPNPRYRTLISELPGLPLVLLQSVCFVWSVSVYDWVSAFLFAWWGPGFLIVAFIYLYAKKQKIEFNWRPLARFSSYTCKINYLAFMAVFYYFEMPGMMYVYSVWIIHDQINMAVFELNADRTRRTFEDYWIFRICYAALLFVPFCYEMEYQTFFQGLGLLLFTLWVGALYRIYQSRTFFKKPKDLEFLRNIIYLAYIPKK